MSEKYEFRKRFHDLEKEESWLNEMSEKGLALKEIKWGLFKDIYCFEQCDKKYVYREDYNMENAMEAITSPYINFVTETYNCEFVCISAGKIYFRKDAEKGDFPPVYTDLESRIGAEKKQFGKMVGFACGAFVIINSCGLNFYNTFNSDTVFGRIGFICSTIAIVCGVICMAMFISAALQHRGKINELNNVRDENGGE